MRWKEMHAEAVFELNDLLTQLNDCETEALRLRTTIRNLKDKISDAEEAVKFLEDKI